MHSWKIIGFFSKWIKWEAPIDVSLTLPFFYFRDIVIKREEDEPLRHKPHAIGYLYLRHSSDIFRSFIVYFLWVERCHLHFVKIYSNHKVLQHVWPPSKTNLRDSIESSFINEWLDINGIILTSLWWMMTSSHDFLVTFFVFSKSLQFPMDEIYTPPSNFQGLAISCLAWAMFWTMWFILWYYAQNKNKSLTLDI